MADLLEIANNLQAKEAKIPLNTEGKDKLYLTTGIAAYEVKAPLYGTVELVIVDGEVVDIVSKETLRIPGRSRRKR
ncbi:hypothetical protein [Aneurinibacillus aneurinilyticus]|jgi:hypothetical protein|uniref:hypothetical protein n=1 Tax=Aneurinibacillus aneurinilyticus TaxID=1391 RepID=UPI00366EFDF3